MIIGASVATCIAAPLRVKLAALGMTSGLVPICQMPP
jgi:hypothetical protein